MIDVARSETRRRAWADVWSRRAGEHWIRRRGHRYDLDDRGTAWRKADVSGAAALDAAEGVVAAEGFNVNPRGVVSVQAVEGRDIDRLAARLADTSLAVYAELLEHST